MPPAELRPRGARRAQRASRRSLLCGARSASPLVDSRCGQRTGRRALVLRRTAAAVADLVAHPARPLGFAVGDPGLRAAPDSRGAPVRPRRHPRQLVGAVSGSRPRRAGALAKLTGGPIARSRCKRPTAPRRSQILAGTAAASGPGIDLQITDPQHQVAADVLLDTLEELRDAGAEAIQITGSAASAASRRHRSCGSRRRERRGDARRPRQVPRRTPCGSSPAATFVDAPGRSGLVVDGVSLAPPYDIVAIGDPHTITTAMGIPGGVLDTLTAQERARARCSARLCPGDCVAPSSRRLSTLARHPRHQRAADRRPAHWILP